MMLIIIELTDILIAGRFPDFPGIRGAAGIQDLLPAGPQGDDGTLAAQRTVRPGRGGGREGGQC